MKSKAVILNNCSIKSTEISNSRGSETNGFLKIKSTYVCRFWACNVTNFKNFRKIFPDTFRVDHHVNISLRKVCPYSEFFSSVFSHIYT